MSIDALSSDDLSTPESSEDFSLESGSQRKEPSESLFSHIPFLTNNISSDKKRSFQILSCKTNEENESPDVKPSFLSHFLRTLFLPFFIPKNKNTVNKVPHTLKVEDWDLFISKKYDLGRQEIGKGQIGFINGMLTNYKEAKQHAIFLSSLADNYNIHGIYNVMRSLNLSIFESFFPLNTTCAFLLQDQWRSFFKEHPDQKYLQICHSQGALHVQKALISLSEEERKRIIVIAIAPQVIISKSFCYEAHNYVSTHDPIPYLNINGTVQMPSPEVHICIPEKKAPFWDHDFESPTYVEALKLHIKTYIESTVG